MKRDFLLIMTVSALVIIGIAALSIPIYISGTFNLGLGIKIVIGIVLFIILISAVLEIFVKIRLIINTKKILSYKSSFITNLVYSTEHMKYMARSVNVNDVEFSNDMKFYYDICEINNHINFGEYNTVETKLQELNLDIMSHSAEAGYYIALGHFDLLAHGDTEAAVQNYEKAYTTAKNTSKTKKWNGSDARIVAYYLEMSKLLNSAHLDKAQVREFGEKVSKIFLKNELVHMYWGLASMYGKLNDQAKSEFYLNKCKKIAPYFRAYHKAMTVPSSK